MSRDVIAITYSYPGPAWDTIRAHAAQVKAVVFNPDNGVGKLKDGEYVRLREEIRTLGIIVLGYTFTGSGDIGGERTYSNRDPAEVLAEMRQWKQWYDVDGYFFDEVSTSKDKVRYGIRTVGSARTVVPQAFVVLNFGQTPDVEWTELDAIYCVVETRQSSYLTRNFPPYIGTSAGRCLDIIYDVTDLAAVWARFVASGHRYIYM